MGLLFICVWRYWVIWGISFTVMLLLDRVSTMSL